MEDFTVSETTRLQTQFESIIEAHGIANDERVCHELSGNANAQRQAQNEMTRLGRLAIDIQLRQIPEAVRRAQIGQDEVRPATQTVVGNL
jgi:hypothetical protein